LKITIKIAHSWVHWLLFLEAHFSQQKCLSVDSQSLMSTASFPPLVGGETVLL